MLSQPALITVALAHFEDIPAWLVLAGEVEPLFGPMVDDPNFRRVLEKNILRGTARCVRQDNGPPGSPLWGGFFFSPKPPLYTLSWLAVTASQRHRGIGRKLVEQAFRLITPPAEVMVTTFGANHPDRLASQAARRFYENLGFHPAETAPDGPEGGSRQVFRMSII